MKKLFVIMLACAMLITIMTACSSHSHTESENWVADPTGHWKQCDGCNKKLQYGKHTFNDEFICTVCSSEVNDIDDCVSVTTYDENGNSIREALYNTHGKLESEIVYENEYDNDGNLKKSKGYQDGFFCFESEYTVKDGESFIKKGTQYYEDGGKSVDEYDDNGNLFKSIEYDADGNVSNETVRQYAKNSDGEWYEAVCTESFADTKIKEEYNDHQDIISRTTYDADSHATSTETWKYTYDDEGFTTKIKEYVDGVLSEETIYKGVTMKDGTFTNYPETVTTYDKNGGKTVCVYNEKDKLVSETKYDADGNVVD